MKKTFLLIFSVFCFSSYAQVTIPVTSGFEAVTPTSAASYTVLPSDYNVKLTALTNQSVTLPSASSLPNRIFTISNQTIWVKTISSVLENDGIASTTILDGENVKVISDGTNWYKIGGFNKTINRSKRFVSGSFSSGGISIGGLTFSFTNNGFNTRIQAASVNGSSRLLNVISTLLVANTTTSETNNVNIGGATALHTGTTDLTNINYKLVQIAQDALTGEVWNITAVTNSTSTINLSIVYTRP